MLVDHRATEIGAPGADHQIEPIVVEVEARAHEPDDAQRELDAALGEIVRMPRAEQGAEVAQTADHLRARGRLPPGRVGGAGLGDLFPVDPASRLHRAGGIVKG
jgi:hypothetical protein